MYSYIIGEIVEINVDHIVVENNGIGYLIYVSNPYEFTKGKEIKVYLYKYVKDTNIKSFNYKKTEENILNLSIFSPFPEKETHRKNPFFAC